MAEGVRMRWGAGVLVIALLASSTAHARKEPLLNMVGVCVIPDQPGGWAVVWHTELPEIDRRTSDRVFKHLEGPEFDACLRLLITSDARTAASVLALVVAPDEKAYRLASRRVGKRWRSSGVDDAIEEVARTGSRGERVDRVLKTCESLRSGSERPRE